MIFASRTGRTRSARSERVLVSAHRAGEAGAEGVRAAVTLGADYVELDVHRSPGGRLVVAHDRPADESAPLLSDALAALDDRVGVHLDLKVASGEAEVVGLVVAAVGVERVVVTTAEDASLPRLRAWSEEAAPGLLLGLSTAARSSRGTWASRRLVRAAAWFPRTRMRRAGVDVVVSHHVVARWWLASWARRRGLPLLVWTVDDVDDLTHWLVPGRAWMVTSNHPARALALRPH